MEGNTADVVFKEISEIILIAVISCKELDTLMKALK